MNRLPTRIRRWRTRQGGLEADGYFRTGVWITVVVLALSPPLQSVKLLDITRVFGQGLFYAHLTLTTLLFGASFLLFLGRNRLRLDGLDLLLACLLAWGGAFTLFFGGSPVDIGGNVLRIVFVLSCYQMARRYADTATVSRALRRFGVLGAVGVLAGLAIIYSLGVFGPLPVYVGLSTQGLFVALAYVLAREESHDWLWVALLMVLIIAGGKRGNMLAALGMIVAGVLFVRRMSVGKAVTVVGVSAGAAFFLVGINYGALAGALPEPVAQRFLVWIPGASGTAGIDLATATANRFTEVLAVVEMWKENPTAMFSGFGFGAIIPKGYGTTASTVHISPVALAFQFGIPLAVIVLAALWWIPVRWLFRRRSSASVEERTWWLTGVGLLALSATVMTVFQDPVLWLALGRLSAAGKV